MRTQESPELPELPKLQGRYLGLQRQKPFVRERAGSLRQGSGTAEEQALRERRLALMQEHRDLDNMITMLLESSHCDEALIARLKKRKLHLKDKHSRFL